MKEAQITVVKQGWRDESRWLKSLAQVELILDSDSLVELEEGGGRVRQEWSGLSSDTSHDLAISLMSRATRPLE